MSEERAVDLMGRNSQCLLLFKVLVPLCVLYFLLFCFSTVQPTYAAAWGDANFGIYPFKSSMVAPNGLIYNPLAHIGINLNIGNDSIYLFDENMPYFERPTPGVTTNPSQGNFDFTKREIDFKIGLAARPLIRFDARMMYVHLFDGREIGVSLTWFPKLWDARDDQRKKWHLTGSGTGIRCDNLQEDISVAELLKG